MQYIILDMEWNQAWPGSSAARQPLPSPMRGEIVQIGAVRMSEDQEIGDEFQVLIRPKYFKKMNSKVAKLTGIRDSVLREHGIPFAEAIEQFRAWCGEDITILTWGFDDIAVLRENLAVHGMEADWASRWYNAQLIFNAQTDGSSNQKALKTALEIMEIEPDIKDRADAKELTDVRGDITFEDVSFQYEENTEQVLQHINLTVPAGSYMALVGASGAGKSTLCSLIPRFYDVTEGAVKVDGTDVRDLTLKSLRDHIGMVQQDVYLFVGTVYENIRYGRPDATREEVIEAAKNANAHEFIMSLPQGYETDIGQRGIKLSGGQKQRLSIARVFLKNPPILIFDEATSALDNESEKVVQDSLEKLAKNRTTFVIAHRLSTIKNAEKILVLTENGIEEEGTHEELLAKKGIYEKLYHMQFQKQ